MNHNILVLLPKSISPICGGMERVYYNLTPYLRKQGCNVFAMCHVRSEYDDKDVYTDIFFADEMEFSHKSKEMLLRIIEEQTIDIVICAYQNFPIVQFLSKVTGPKIIHHIHNIPSAYLYPKVRIIPFCLKGTWIDSLLRHIRFNIRFKRAMRNMALSGQHIVILSETFRNDLQSVFPFEDSQITAIPNPFAIDTDFELDKQDKQKTILYVGRLAENQKRISSLLNIWGKIQDAMPDYSLQIVGDGPQMEDYKRKVGEGHLERVTFFGFQNPMPYYKKAEIECMTSNFEGFSMVLVEAMQYGCVPFAFNSFTALSDIIDDDVNGYIIPAFDEDEYAKKVIAYLKLPEGEKYAIRQNAIVKSKSFDVENVGKRWIDLFDKL